MKRIYYNIVRNHLKNNDQMVFLVGPRRVGKTTISEHALKDYKMSLYLNWDNTPDKELILKGTDAVAKQLDLKRTPIKLEKKEKIIVFDEIHKFSQWQTWLKGFFDVYHRQVHIIVTGSAKLDVYRRGGDSMMGRYFLYHVHPLSVAELKLRSSSMNEISQQQTFSSSQMSRLIDYGGFPEPYLKEDKQFHTRWSKSRNRLIFQQEIRDMTRIQEVAQLEILAKILSEQVGKNSSFSSLARKVCVSSLTIKRWIATLNMLYYSFTVKPWTKNITRSLIKEPKYYLWDWSLVNDQGARLENLVASHLLKAVHYWSDIGLGAYELYYLRDKDKREVDFVVTKDRKPWFLVEVKTSNHHNITPALKHFHKQTKAPHAFQVVFDEPYADVDCFSYTEPIIVPASTFLSQLV